MNEPGRLRRCDLHLHTCYSAWTRARILRARDAGTDPVEAFRRARAAGMDYVALTDHDSIDGALRLRDALPDRAAEIIVGEEVETVFPETGQRLHVNVYGLDEGTHAEVQRLRRNVRELVAYLRSRHLLHVLNHPFWSYRFQKRPRAYVEDLLDLFDHFEVGNSTMPPGHAEAAEAMLRYALALGLRKTAVAGSDAHSPGHIGSSWTSAAGDSAAAFLASVARGECAYRTAPIGFPAVLAHIYRAIGHYYAGLTDPEGRRGMRAVNYVAAAAFLPAATVLGVPAILAVLNEIKQRAVIGFTRKALERLAEGEAAAALEAVD